MFNFDHSNQKIELNWCLDSHICSKLVPNDDEWATNDSNICNSLKISESTGKLKKISFFIFNPKINIFSYFFYQKKEKNVEI